MQTLMHPANGLGYRAIEAVAAVNLQKQFVPLLARIVPSQKDTYGCRCPCGQVKFLNLTRRAEAGKRNATVRCAQEAQRSAETAAGEPPKEIRVLFRMYEEDCRPTNSFMEFGITCDADIRRVLDLMHWSDAVDITPGSAAGGKLVTSIADLQPYGWYDRIETFLNLRRTQSRLKTTGHDAVMPVQLERLLGDQYPGLRTLSSRVFYKDWEQHHRWQEAQANLTELAREKKGSVDVEILKELLQVQDSERALEFDSVALSENRSLVVGDYAETGGVTAIENLREKVDRLEAQPELAEFDFERVVPVLCVKGYDRASSGKHGVSRYAQQKGVLLAERSLTGTDSLLH